MTSSDISPNAMAISFPFGTQQRAAYQAYDVNAAEDSWQRVITFFGEHLRG